MYHKLVNLNADLDISWHKMTKPIDRFFDHYGIPFIIVLGIIAFSFVFAGFIYYGGSPHQHVNCFQIFYRRLSGSDTSNSTSFLQDWFYICLVFGCIIGGLIISFFGIVGLDALTNYYHRYKHDVRRAISRKEKN